VNAGPGHAAVLHDREQNVQIAQAQAAPDSAFPIEGLGH
jgi:hypothetical protein